MVEVVDVGSAGAASGVDRIVVMGTAGRRFAWDERFRPRLCAARPNGGIADLGHCQFCPVVVARSKPRFSLVAPCGAVHRHVLWHPAHGVRRGPRPHCLPTSRYRGIPDTRSPDQHRFRCVFQLAWILHGFGVVDRNRSSGIGRRDACAVGFGGGQSLLPAGAADIVSRVHQERQAGLGGCAVLFRRQLGQSRLSGTAKFHLCALSRDRCPRRLISASIELGGGPGSSAPTAGAALPRLLPSAWGSSVGRPWLAISCSPEHVAALSPPTCPLRRGVGLRG